jgi:hypothetical protein
MIWKTLKTIAKVIFWVHIVFGVFIIPLVYFELRKASLEQKIDCHTVSWLERETSDEEHLQRIPEAVLDNPNALQHKKYSISIPNYTITDQSTEHFTQLLRHLAYLCSGRLAGYCHRRDSKGYQQTSDRASFVKGEPLNFLYDIIERGPARVEVSRVEECDNIRMTHLVVMHLDVTPSKGAVLVLETLKWLSEGTGKDLPLDEIDEKRVPCFLPPEIARAAFLVYGAEYLETNIPMPQVEEEKLVDDGFVECVGDEYLETAIPKVEEEKLDDDDGFVMVHPVGNMQLEMRPPGPLDGCRGAYRYQAGQDGSCGRLRSGWEMLVEAWDSSQVQIVIVCSIDRVRSSSHEIACPKVQHFEIQA